MAKTLFLYGEDSGELHKLEWYGNDAFLPAGKILACGDSEGTVRLWRGFPRGQLCEFRAHEGSIFSLAFSTDGGTLVSGGEDRTVRVWQAGTGEQVGSFTGHTASVLCAAISANGQRVASGSGDKTVRIWEIGKRKKPPALKGHTGSVISVAFSPDNTRLASGSEDKTIRIWKVGGRKKPHPLKGHTGAVVSLAFSPDGKTVASGSEDRTVCVWNANAHKKLCQFKNHPGSVVSLTYSHDGTILAAGSRNEAVRLWDVSSGELLGEAASVVSTGLWYPRLGDANNVVLILSPRDASNMGRPLRRLFADMALPANRTFLILLSPFTRAESELGIGLHNFVQEMFRRYFGVIPKLLIPPARRRPEAAREEYSPLQRCLERHTPGNGIEFSGAGVKRGPERVSPDQKEVVVRPLVRFHNSGVACASAVRRERCVWALVSMASVGLRLEDARDLREVSLRLTEWEQEKSRPRESPDSMRAEDVVLTAWAREERAADSAGRTAMATQGTGAAETSPKQNDDSVRGKQELIAAAGSVEPEKADDQECVLVELRGGGSNPPITDPRNMNWEFSEKGVEKKIAVDGVPRHFSTTTTELLWRLAQDAPRPVRVEALVKHLGLPSGKRGKQDLHTYVSRARNELVDEDVVPETMRLKLLCTQKNSYGLRLPRSKISFPE